MRPLLSILLAPALLAAEDAGNSTAETSPDRQLPAVSLMPAGSVLTKVMIPRYDLQRKLTTVLRAEKLTVIDEQTVEGENVSVELYNPDRTPSGRIDLAKAIFDQRRGVLESKQTVEIVSTDFTAQGTGLTYAYQQGQGFLLGPVRTRLLSKPKTSMNFPSTPRLATGLATALISLPAFAERPLPLSPEAKATLEAQATSLAPEQQKAVAETKGQITEDLRVSGQATQAVAAFLKQAAITTISLETSPVPAPAAKPLDVRPSPGDTVIESDDGMYLDQEKGVLVYLKNVRLSDPRLTLTGADELKIFFEKKPEAKPAAKPGEKPSEKPATEADKDKATAPLAKKGAGFGNVEKIIATGTLKIVQKPLPGEVPFEASAGLMTYNVKTKELVLSGRYPWFRQGDKVFRALEENLSVRIDGEFNAATQGNWQTLGRLDNQTAPPKLLGDPKDWEGATTAGLKKINFSFTPDPKLPNLLVLGDNISIGYTLPLREQLKGHYNTFRPIEQDGRPQSCETSSHALKNLDAWLGNKKWSVISFNFGLGDTAMTNDTPVVPLATYKTNLQSIVDRLKKTGARLIWASTTAPLPADGKHAAAVVAYNEAAKEIMERNQIEISDLHAASLTVDASMKEDKLHLYGPGSRTLASKLSEAVKAK